MKKKVNNRIEITSFIFDILIMLSPTTLFMDNPLDSFTVIFYLIYLPNLIFNIYKCRYKKKNNFLLNQQFQKINIEDFFIHD